MENELLQKALIALEKVDSGNLISIDDLYESFTKKEKQELQDESNLEKFTERLTLLAKEKNIFLTQRFLGYSGIPTDCLFMVQRKVNKSEWPKEKCNRICYKDGGYMSCLYDQTDIQKECLSESNWEKLVDEVFDNCKLLDWFDIYEDPNILDGSYWKIELYFDGGKVLTYNGSNAEPKNFRKFRKILSQYGKSEEVLLSE